MRTRELEQAEGTRIFINNNLSNTFGKGQEDGNNSCSQFMFSFMSTLLDEKRYNLVTKLSQF